MMQGSPRVSLKYCLHYSPNARGLPKQTSYSLTESFLFSCHSPPRKTGPTYSEHLLAIFCDFSCHKRKHKFQFSQHSIRDLLLKTWFQFPRCAIFFNRQKLVGQLICRMLDLKCSKERGLLKRCQVFVTWAILPCPRDPMQILYSQEAFHISPIQGRKHARIRDLIPNTSSCYLFETSRKRAIWARRAQ